MVKIVVDVTGEERVAAMMRRLDGAPEKVAKLAGLVVRDQTRERFNTKEGPDGRWAPWAPSTAAQKPAGWSLMVASSTLSQIPPPSVSGLEARVGTNVQYAAFHQHGTHKMPARPIFGLSSSNEAQLQRRIEDFLDAMVNR